MRKMTDTGRFTVRNPIYARTARPAVLLATIAGAAMTGLAFAPQTAALAADHATEVAALTSTGQPVQQNGSGGAASDRLCAGQPWGNETSDCLVALAFDAGGKRQASIRIVAIQ